MSRRTASVALLGALLALSGPAQGRGGTALQTHQHVWVELSIDGQDYYSGAKNYLLLAEGLRAGNTGFIYDPRLFSYSASGGLLDYHVNYGGDWTHSFGWMTTLMLNGFPASRIPVSFWVNHMTLGLAPGGNPILNLMDQTMVGGRVPLRLEGWPSVALSGIHSIQTVNQSLTGTALQSASSTSDGPKTVKQTTLSLQLVQAVGNHRYAMNLDLRDQADEDLQTRARSASFVAADQTLLTPELSLGAAVNGQLGETGTLDLEQRTAHSHYGARLVLNLSRPSKLNLRVNNYFQRVTLGDSGYFSDSLVGQMQYSFRPWLEFLFGLAAVYLQEEESGGQRAAREEAASGARIARSLLGGMVSGSVLLRLGESQVVDEGHGLFFAATSNLSWRRRLGTHLEATIRGLASGQWDHSPIGSDQQNLSGRARMALLPGLGLGASLEGYVTYADQEETAFSTFTDTSTSVGGVMALTLPTLPWMSANASGGYSAYLASAQGVDHNYHAAAHVLLQPLIMLTINARAVLMRYARSGQSDFTQLRVDGTFSWIIRQLTLQANYVFLIDDHRGIGAGDHRVTFRIVRRFDLRFGRAQ